MSISIINAEMFKKMLVSAVNNLEHNKQLINDLNVFPVPDGDTGTNMFLTIVSAVKEVCDSESTVVGALAKLMGNGALKGARGNSGVITSQLFRGFSKAIAKDKETIDAADFAAAITKGVDAAYKAVMKPKEGTILTVAKGMSVEAEKQIEAGQTNILALVDAVINAGEITLAKTPDMLPVLKEAGVVDAGGAGLITIYKGFRHALNGEEIVDDLDLSKPASEEVEVEVEAANTYNIGFYIVNLKKEPSESRVNNLKSQLKDLGGNVSLENTDKFYKVTVNTETPDKVLGLALSLGDVTNVWVENIKTPDVEAVEEAKPEVPQKPIAIVSVSAGEGLGKIFKDYNVDELVSGGQSMNPSAYDISKAVDAAPSQNVIVLPNNKNIVLAAEQAQHLTEKNIYVVPTRSFPQGLSALLAFIDGEAVESNVENMKEAVSTVKSGLITKAVRDSKIVGHDFTVTKDEFIGLLEDEIVAHGAEIDTCIDSLLENMVTEDDSIITLYYGDSVTEEEAEALKARLEEKYSDFDVECYNGGEPVYNYIISVE